MDAKRETVDRVRLCWGWVLVLTKPTEQSSVLVKGFFPEVGMF